MAAVFVQGRAEGAATGAGRGQAWGTQQAKEGVAEWVEEAGEGREGVGICLVG